MLRILIVGYGRMGHLVESLAPEFDMRVAGVIDRTAAANPVRWPEADVAIDFSSAEAVRSNAPALAARGVDLVIGTTGWHADAQQVRDAVAPHGIGVVAAPNFAVGVNLFLALVAHAAVLMHDQPSFGAWIHELHHAAKKDAPSGTALAMAAAVQRAGYEHHVDIASTRAGAIPGTHTFGFDSAAETITLTHAARDRTAFARGALHAARWVRGRRGWFGMQEVLGIS
jgi:4-hydroxy-tetrahydrodipicolinate reductase